MFETCIVCREVPPMSGESYCETCVRTLDNAPESTVQFAAPMPEKPSADGSPTQSGESPISVVVEEEFDEPSGSEILRVTPKNSPGKISAA